jgi:DNA-binding XRE family transcriptional regulator
MLTYSLPESARLPQCGAPVAPASLDPVRPTDLALIAQTRADLASGRAREARRAAGLHQQEIAGALGVSRQAVTGWEAGKRVPSSVHALAYGRLLRQLARRAA